MIQVETLKLSAEMALNGCVIAGGVVVIYALLAFVLRKNTEIMKMILKGANVVAAVLVLFELILGNVFGFFGDNSLSYFVIFAATIAMVNSISDMVDIKN